MAVLGHGPEGGALLIDDFVEDHLQVLVGIVALLADVLDLCADACHLVVFIPDVGELALEAVLEDVRRE